MIKSIRRSANVSSSRPSPIILHNIFIIVTIKHIVFAVFAFFTVAQSQQFQIQNWGNGEDTTNYTYKSLAAGRFTLDWVLGPGGNFVAGKGYKGSPNLFVLQL